MGTEGRVNIFRLGILARRRLRHSPSGEFREVGQIAVPHTSTVEFEAEHIILSARRHPENGLFDLNMVFNPVGLGTSTQITALLRDQGRNETQIASKQLTRFDKTLTVSLSERDLRRLKISVTNLHPNKGYWYLN